MQGDVSVVIPVDNEEELIDVIDGAALTTLKTHMLITTSDANRISTALATAIPASPHP